MGSHLHVYLGPYVEGTYRDETQEVDVTGCTNDKCSEYVKRDRWSQPVGKFCPTCANPIGKSKKVEALHRSPYDVLEGREALTPLGHDSQYLFVWLGANIKGPRDFHPNDEGVWDLTSLNHAAEMMWFEQRFAEDLAKLQAAYDNVTVRWGLRMYYM